MLQVADFLAQFSSHEYHDLANALMTGAGYAGLAADSLESRALQQQDVARFLAYPTQAIDQLEVARALVGRRA